MVSSGMLRRVALVRTDVSEEPSARCEQIPIFLCSVRRLLVAASVVASSPILLTLMNKALGSSETSVLTRATRRNIQQDTVLVTTLAFVPISPILVSQMIEALSSSETSVLTRATRRNITAVKTSNLTNHWIRETCTNH
jgi:hypothetical protein